MSSTSSYKRLGKLGSGAFATTFIVEETGKKNTKKLVMKRVPCKHMRAANAALQEVKVLLSCTHDGIVGYHDFFLDTDGDDNIVICLVMEHCDGGDLWEKIAQARREKSSLPPRMVAGWSLQLIAALRYLHARSILHRDIKPENVFITDEGQVVKLGDFGLAVANDGLDGSAKTQVGTPDYMAPEVLEGRPYSAPADVFSLGATLYAMVCSSFPKMLAMFLGQGKTLEWSAASEPMADWRPLVTQMLNVGESERPSLDEIGARCAGLSGADDLDGISLAAKHAATQPVSLDGSSGSSGAGTAPAAAPAAAPVSLPSRPSQPMATEVTHGQVVLLWEPPPPTDVVAHYRVLTQKAGTNGFHVLLDDTNSNQPIVRLSTLEEDAWYEFKVVAVNAAGESLPSLGSQPVQTKGQVPPSAAVPRAHHCACSSHGGGSHGGHHGHAAAAAYSSGDDPEYAQIKRELSAWESKFEKQHGHPPTEHDKAADAAYQAMLSRYRRFRRHRKSNASGSSEPEAAGAAPYADEAHLVASHAASPATPYLEPRAAAVAPDPSGGSFSQGAHEPSRERRARASDVGCSPQPATTPAATPATPTSASPAKSKRDRQKKSSRKKAAKQTTLDERSMTNMTVALKASHPSPRMMSEETFD